jgi:hypothetical protein
VTRRPVQFLCVLTRVPPRARLVLTLCPCTTVFRSVRPVQSLSACTRVHFTVRPVQSLSACTRVHFTFFYFVKLTHICEIFKVLAQCYWFWYNFKFSFYIFSLPSLRVLYPWRLPHGRPKHVAVLRVYKLILIYLCAFNGAIIVRVYSTEAWKRKTTRNTDSLDMN